MDSIGRMKYVIHSYKEIPFEVLAGPYSGIYSYLKKKVIKL